MKQASRTSAVLCLAAFPLVCYLGWGQQTGGTAVPQPSPVQRPSAALVVTPAPLDIPAGARRPDRMLQMGHTGQITALAFSPDGGKLASGSADGNFVVADASTGKPLYSRDFHQWVDAVAFSPDGQYMAVSIEQSEEEEQSTASIQIYRADIGQEFRTVPLPWSSAPQLVITADHLLISSGFEGGEDSG